MKTVGSVRKIWSRECKILLMMGNVKDIVLKSNFILEWLFSVQYE